MKQSLKSLMILIDAKQGAREYPKLVENRRKSMFCINNSEVGKS